MSWRNGMLDQRMEEQKKKKKRQEQPRPDEEMDEEMAWPGFVPLNRSKSVFDTAQGNRTAGINTAPSVFDRQAVFHTGEE